MGGRLDLLAEIGGIVIDMYLSHDTLDFGFDKMTNQQLEKLFAELMATIRVKPHLFTAQDVTRELRYRLTRFNNGIGFTEHVRHVAAEVINVLYNYFGWKKITAQDLYVEVYDRRTKNQLRNLANLYRTGGMRWKAQRHRKIIKQLKKALFLRD